MTAGITSLVLRSSPARRSIPQKAAQRVHARTFGPQKPPSSAVPMLGRAVQNQGSKGPSQRDALSKQLFPSSSPQAPNGDIRDNFKRHGAASVSAAARTPQPFPAAPYSRPVTLNQSAGTNRGSLASLYNNSDSFKHEPAVIDLTGPEAQAKAREAVYFAEDDFSDDDTLDLDFQAPSALPAPAPVAAPGPLAKQHMPPPSSSHNQQDTKIPWSSSPPEHYLPPQPRPSPLEVSKPTDNPPKRRHDSSEAPVQKEAKKRKLPWKSEASGEEDGYHVAPPIKTPSHSKSRDYLDPTASAIKEGKRQLKSQRQPQNNDASDKDIKEITKSHAKTTFNPISLSEEQRHVKDLVVNKNQSVFFTGPAGTGKSVLMRAIIEELKRKYSKDPERVAVTASTGLAACNIGGITLHSFSGIGLGKEDAPTLVKKVRRNPKAKNRWLRTKCLVIDEVSMVDGELFDKLSQIGRSIRNNGRPWGGIQLIITGDFFQLPPVPDKGNANNAKFAFDASTWSTSIDHTIGLTQVFRQRDPEFARMLNEMRLGKISEGTVQAFRALSRPLEVEDGLDASELFSTRSEVENSNERRLRDLPGKTRRYDALDTGNPDIREKLLANMMAPKSIELKLDAQVMLIKNLDETLVNGSLGKVIGFSDEKTFDMETKSAYESDEDAMAKAKRKLAGFGRDAESNGQKFPVVQFGATDGTRRVILCQPEEWKVELPNGEVQATRSQLPLILAWALSIHKAQGQTLERVKVNLGRVFEKGQAYVALSRATSQQGLQVLNFNKTKVMAHPRVVAFYNKLYSVEEAMGKKPTSISDFMNNRKGSAPPAQKAPQAISLDDDEEAMASYGY